MAYVLQVFVFLAGLRLIDHNFFNRSLTRMLEVDGLCLVHGLCLRDGLDLTTLITFKGRWFTLSTWFKFGRISESLACDDLGLTDPFDFIMDDLHLSYDLLKYDESFIVEKTEQLIGGFKIKLRRGCAFSII